MLAQECSKAVYVGKAFELSHLLLKHLAVAAACLCLMRPLLPITTAGCFLHTSRT
jgi:hypothetical protein